MRASGKLPAARRADTSASKPSSSYHVTPRRAASPAPLRGPGLLKRVGRTTAGLAAGTAMIGGLIVAGAQPASASTPPSLHFGNRGTAVVRLQRELTARGLSVPATGYFGSITKGRVNQLKASRGWRTDGVAGQRVWYFLLHDGHPVASTTSATTTSSRAIRALNYAKAHLGDPYVYGAAGPNAFDCSGLTMAAYRSAGISLAHNSTAQYNEIRHVSKSNLRLGDLVFFYSGRSHVAIYAGNGRVIHAGRPGQPIQYIKMSYMPYAGAGRPA